MATEERIDLKAYVWGDTEEDIGMALDEIKRLTLSGFTSGFDKTDDGTGGYRFNIENKIKDAIDDGK